MCTPVCLTNGAKGASRRTYTTGKQIAGPARGADVIIWAALIPEEVQASFNFFIAGVQVRLLTTLQRGPQYHANRSESTRFHEVTRQRLAGWNGSYWDSRTMAIKHVANMLTISPAWEFNSGRSLRNLFKLPLQRGVRQYSFTQT